MGTLLAAKLYLPVASSDAVARPRLLHYLDAGLQARLILICAPAGWGKTTIASAWLRSLLAENDAGGRALRVAWFAIDEYDDDLTTFTACLAAAIRQACPGLLGGWFDLDRRPSPPEPEAVAAELLAALAPIDHTLLIAFDDYHLVTAAPVHRFMSHFLRHLPPSVHLLITARHEPPIGVSQLRARHQVVELLCPALAFTLEETNAFLHRTIDGDLAPGTVDTLWQHTEGWLAGLRLAAISLQASQDRALFVRRFAEAGTPEVAGYLVDQVLASQPPAVHDFLLQTSILSRLSSELCAALASQHQFAGTGILDYLDRNNVFLVPLDDFGEWYRYYGQFRCTLHDRLVSQYAPEAVADLHRRAAQWLAARGDVEEAVAHYVAAGDADAAAAVLEGLIPDLLRRKQWHQSARYLSLLPEATVQRRPALLLLQCWIGIHDYNLAKIRLLVEQAEALLQDGEWRQSADPADVAALYGQISALRTRASMGRVPLADSLASGHEALRLLPPAHVWERTFTLSTLSHVLLAFRGYAAARNLLEAELLAGNSQYAEYSLGIHYALAIVSYVAGAWGEFEAASITLGRLALALDMPGEIQLAKCMAGLLHMERNDRDAAFTMFTEVVSRPDLTHILGLRVTAYPLLEMYAERGMVAEGDALLAVLRGRLEQNLDPEGAAETDVLAAFWAVLKGDRSAAEQYVRGAPLVTPVFHLYHRGLIQVRILLALGGPLDLVQAADLAQRQAVDARKYNNTFLAVNALALLAQACWLRDRPVRALAVLRRAITLGYPLGFRRVFCEPASPVAAMLSRLAVESAFAAPAQDLLAEIARLAGAGDICSPAPQ